MIITQPIKRSPELQPLSRDHHEGLLFCWKLRQGIQNGTSLSVLCSYVNWFWQNHIKAHFFNEEKVLMPLLPSGHQLSVCMKDDHEYIREIILSLDNVWSNQELLNLAGLIEKHIRFEEREFFNYLEQTLSPGQMQRVEEQLVELPPPGKKWKNEFWVKGQAS